jgi:sulfatase maturation enzyme AslB (radical SAM superfamily)
MNNDRIEKLAGIKNTHCNACYAAECGGGSSKRVRENLKSKIYNNQKLFDISFARSPDYTTLSSPDLSTVNIRSFHLSLGNECNLYCRTCEPSYSSKIAFMEKVTPIRLNWTNNDTAWQHLLDAINTSTDLQFVHVIGGEPFLNYRFEQLIDALISMNKTEIYFGFSTNGTIYREEIYKKLQNFKHIDVGISLETPSKLNDFIRAGSNTADVIANIKKIQQFQAPNYYVTLRCVLSALSVHEYDNTLKWALENNLGILTNTLEYPPQQQVRNLPEDIKQRLIKRFETWDFSDHTGVVTNGREPELQKFQADNEIKNAINLLRQPNDPNLTEKLYGQLTSWQWFEDNNIRNYFFVT